MRSIIVAMMLLSVSAISVAGEADENMLQNPGFEDDWDKDGIPESWIMRYHKGRPTGGRRVGSARSGEASVHVSTAGGDEGFWSQTVVLPSGVRRVELTAWGRTEGQAQANVSIAAYSHAPRKWISADYGLIVFKNKRSWTTRTVFYEVPEGAESLRVGLWCNFSRRGPGRAWFDDIRLTMTERMRRKRTPTRLPNAGFEDTRRAVVVPDDWAFSRYKGTAKPLASHPSPRTGRRSPGIAVGPNSAGFLSTWAPMVPDWQIYQLSAWVRTEGDAKALGSLSVYTKHRKKWLAAGYDLFEVASAGKWRQVSGYYKLPDQLAGEFKVGLWARSGPGGGRAWFDDVELQPVEKIPATEYAASNLPPPPSVDEEEAGFIAFNRNYLDLMPPTYSPSRAEIDKPVSVTATRGEYEPISIGIYALRDLENLSIAISPFQSDGTGHICRESLDVRVVRYLFKRSHHGVDDRMLVPTYLERSGSLAVKKGQVGQIWITVQVPRDATAGHYHATLRLSSPQGQRSLEVPIQLQVLPFELSPATGMAFGMYDGIQRTVAGPDFILEKYRDMRAHGMTTVGYMGKLGANLRVVDGKARIAFNTKSYLEKTMDAYARAGFEEPIIWLMLEDVRSFCEKFGPVGSDEFGMVYKFIIQAVLDEGKRQSWPEIIIQPEDEVFSHGKRFKRAHEQLKLLKQIPGLRTEMDGTNVNPQRTAQVYSLTDVLVHCYGPMLYTQYVYPRMQWLQEVEKYHADGKLIWFYNVDTSGYHVETMRFAAGLYMLWANTDGLLSWAYSWGDADPYDDYSGRRGDTVFFYPPRGNRKGGPALGLEGLREGIDDYRYARTLKEQIRAAQLSDDRERRDLASRAQAALDRWLDRINLSQIRTNRSMQGNWVGDLGTGLGLNKVTGSFRMEIGLSFDDYQRFRETCTEYILALSASTEN